MVFVMKTSVASGKPEELRPILHGKIEQMDAQGLAVMHRVLLQLEAEDLSANITSDLSKEKDLVERVAKAVNEFRKSHPYQ